VGLKNKHIVLFPFWFLVTIALRILGRSLTALANQKLIFTRAAFYLYSALIAMMLAHIFGYRPLQSL
jgi:hypothetical protein